MHPTFQVLNVSCNTRVYAVRLYDVFLLFVPLVRLTNAGVQPNVGSVEIFSDNRWAEVCSDKSWDDTDAGVVCRQLGYTSGRALSNVSKDSADFEIWILYKKAYYNFTCYGNETSLLDCKRKRFSSSTCHHNFMAGAVCYNTSLEKVNNSKFRYFA